MSEILKKQNMNEITITLPDASTRNYPAGVTGLAIAESIGAGLLKAALAIKVNGKLQDLVLPINENSEVAIITGKSEEGLEIIRHDTAHLIAEAVKELFPETQVTIGPAIENGFFYDFSRKTPFTPDDLVTIEERMKEIVERDEKITRELWDRDEAVKYFKSIGEFYKAEIIASIPNVEPITLYRQGNFLDLCRGPHAPSTGKVRHFKLLKIAGAYWRGDSNNEMLQRIYGTAWADEKQLKAYLFQLEEADKRDHRKLGSQLGLFHIQEEAPGMIFWHPKGWNIYRKIESYIRNKITKDGYVEVKTPVLVDRILWEKSGHWDKFRENMFTSESEHKTFALKPMNCPCHVQIFNKKLHSYRDLPIRMAEFGNCHRNESSGSMHGLMRVRSMVQDDAHIFCTEDQIESETIKFTTLLKDVYKDFGFTDIRVKFADRPDVRAGTDATWDKAENALKNAIEAAGLEYTINKGEGAFYGPKLEFVLKDAIGRDWQCGTFQVDYVLPERLDANYIAANGEKQRPVMLHRAILGSFERFIGILIEEFSGKFPLWLAPTQAMVTTITEKANGYAKEVFDKLLDLGVQVELDDSDEKINYKIRKHLTNKVPVIIVVGAKEAEEKTVSIRRLDSEATVTMGLNEFCDAFLAEIKMPS